MRRQPLFLIACIGVGAFALLALLPPKMTPPSSTPAVPSTAPSPTAPIIHPTDPIRGLANAPLTIIEFADFTCSHCADVEPILAGLQQQYGARLKIVWKDLPVLDRITRSRSLHIAARCAQRQGKFWEYHDALFRNVVVERDDRTLLAIANGLGLNTERFAMCLADAAVGAAVAADEREARGLGITATPTLFVNGERLDGEITLDAITSRLNIVP